MRCEICGKPIVEQTRPFRNLCAECDREDIERCDLKASHRAGQPCPLRARDLKPLVRELADALEGQIYDDCCDEKCVAEAKRLHALVDRARKEAG